MKSATSRRLLASPNLFPTIESSLAYKSPSQCLRLFSHSASRRADDGRPSAPPAETPIPSPPRTAKPFPTFGMPPPRSPSLNPKSSTSDLASTFSSLFENNNQLRRANYGRNNPLDMDVVAADGGLLPTRDEMFKEAHRLHVYATRHNTHITVTGPPGSKGMKPDPKKPFNGGVIISMACGNIGFKKSGRKHYDSAFQLASYIMTRMQEAGVSADIQKLEVYLRGFGAGREAVTKALLGTEGRYLRGKVVKVSDTTRLKFGGTRSKKPRRLG